MWAHQPFVNQPKQGFNLMPWPRLELICRWHSDGAVRLALWELEGWRVVLCRGRGSWMEGRLCHVPAHTQQLTNRERNVSSGHTHTHGVQSSKTECLAVLGQNAGLLIQWLSRRLVVRWLIKGEKKIARLEGGFLSTCLCADNWQKSALCCNAETIQLISRLKDDTSSTI